MSFEKYYDALVRLFAPLHRKGPGSDEFSAQILGKLKVSPNATVVDLGSGTGAGTFVLAENLDCQITAVDLSENFINELNRKASQKGCKNVKGVVANMDRLPFQKNSLDLIWCDSSIYIVGFAQALNDWKSLLKPGGIIAASDIVWKTRTPSKENELFWQDEYPDMSTIKTRVEQIEQHGYQLEFMEEMPRSTIWDAYYCPLEKRLDELEEQGGHDEVMQQVIVSTRNEVGIFKKYEKEWGSAFFVMQKV